MTSQTFSDFSWISLSALDDVSVASTNSSSEFDLDDIDDISVSDDSANDHNDDDYQLPPRMFGPDYHVPFLPTVPLRVDRTAKQHASTLSAPVEPTEGAKVDEDYLRWLKDPGSTPLHGQCPASAMKSVRLDSIRRNTSTLLSNDRPPHYHSRRAHNSMEMPTMNTTGSDSFDSDVAPAISTAVSHQSARCMQTAGVGKEAMSTAFLRWCKLLWLARVAKLEPIVESPPAVSNPLSAATPKSEANLQVERAALEREFNLQHETVAAQFRKGCAEILDRTNKVVTEAKADVIAAEEKVSTERLRADELAAQFEATEQRLQLMMAEVRVVRSKMREMAVAGALPLEEISHIQTEIEELKRAYEFRDAMTRRTAAAQQQANAALATNLVEATSLVMVSSNLAEEAVEAAAYSSSDVGYPTVPQDPVDGTARAVHKFSEYADVIIGGGANMGIHVNEDEQPENATESEDSMRVAGTVHKGGQISTVDKMQPQRCDDIKICEQLQMLQHAIFAAEHREDMSCKALAMELAKRQDSDHALKLLQQRLEEQQLKLELSEQNLVKTRHQLRQAKIAAGHLFRVHEESESELLRLQEAFHLSEVGQAQRTQNLANEMLALREHMRAVRAQAADMLRMQAEAEIELLAKVSEVTDEMIESPERVRQLEQKIAMVGSEYQINTATKDSVIQRYQQSCTRLERAMLSAASRLGQQRSRFMGAVISSWSRHTTAQHWRRWRLDRAAERVQKLKRLAVFRTWKNSVVVSLLARVHVESEEQTRTLTEAAAAVELHQTAAAEAAQRAWATEVAAEAAIAEATQRHLEHLEVVQEDHRADLLQHAQEIDKCQTELQQVQTTAAADQRELGNIHATEREKLVEQHNKEQSELQNQHQVNQQVLQNELDKERQQALVETEENKSLLLELEMAIDRRRTIILTQRVAIAFVTWSANIQRSCRCKLQASHIAEQEAQKAAEAEVARLKCRLGQINSACAARVALHRKVRAARTIQAAQREHIAAKTTMQAAEAAREAARLEEERVTQPLFHFLTTHGLADKCYDSLRKQKVDLTVLRLCSAKELTQRFGIAPGPALRVQKHLSSWPADPTHWPLLATHSVVRSNGSTSDWLGRPIGVGARCMVRPPSGRAAAEAERALRPCGPHDWLDKCEHPGVVRYVGRLEGKGRAVWVGIELTDHSEGLPAGVVGTAVYFKPHGPGHCLFCKPSQLVLTDGVHKWGKDRSAGSTAIGSSVGEGINDCSARGGGGALTRRQPGRVTRQADPLSVPR